MTIYLSASEVAAAADQHRYKPQQELLAKVFRKICPHLAAKIDAALNSSSATLAFSTIRSLDRGVLEAVASEERPEKRQRLIEATVSAAEKDLIRQTVEGHTLAITAHELAAQRAEENAREAADAHEKVRTASETSQVAAERLVSTVVASEHAEKEAGLQAHHAALQSFRCTEYEKAAREAKVAAEAAERSGHGLESAQRSLEEAARNEEEGRRLVAAAEKAAEEALRIAMEAVEAKRRAEEAAVEAELARNEESVRSEDLDASAAHCAAVTLVRAEELRSAEAMLAAAVTVGPRIGAEVLSHVNTSRGIRDEAAGIAAVPGFVPSSPHALKLAMAGDVVTAYLDGAQLAAVNDGSIAAGNAALGTGWHGSAWRDFRVEAI